jgi:hypothetical protein
VPSFDTVKITVTPISRPVVKMHSIQRQVKCAVTVIRQNSLNSRVPVAGEAMPPHKSLADKRRLDGVPASLI